MATLEELARLIERSAPGDGVHETPVPRLAAIRVSRPSEPIHALQQPAFCIVARGRKQVMLGSETVEYGAGQHLVFSVDLPVIGQIVEAPYLCLRLDLDVAQLGGLMLESAPQRAPSGTPPRGLMLSAVTEELLDAAARLARLADSPGDIATLAPLAEREILYRLLQGDHAGMLREIARADSRSAQIGRAIAWIKQHFRAPFAIETVAALAGMSPSAFHEHFKAVTAMSPLQYQKQLRLQEARRLILAQAMDAASAGHRVGYDSPSQFSREYRRLFGAPPLRDAARLRASPELLAGGA